MTYVSLGLRILLSLAFVGAGGAKLAGVEMMSQPSIKSDLARPYAISLALLR